MAGKTAYIGTRSVFSSHVETVCLSDLHVERETLKKCIGKILDNVNKENAILVNGNLKRTSKFDSNSTYNDVYDWIKGILSKIENDGNPISLVVISETERKKRITNAIEKILRDNKEITGKKDLKNRIKVYLKEKNLDIGETDAFIKKIIDDCVEKEGKNIRCKYN